MKSIPKSTFKVKILPPTQLKGCLNKVYTLDSNEKYELFLLELGVKKPVRVTALNSKPSVSLYVQDNSYVLHSTYPEGKTVKVRFVPGEETYRRKPDGKYVPCTFEVSENVVTEKLNLEDFQIFIERVFTKTELTVMMEVKGVRCYRVFIPSKSRHSIETETSRRSSICHESVIDFVDEYESAPEEELTQESETSSEPPVCY